MGDEEKLRQLQEAQAQYQRDLRLQRAMDPHLTAQSQLNQGMQGIMDPNLVSQLGVGLQPGGREGQPWWLASGIEPYVRKKLPNLAYENSYQNVGDVDGGGGWN